jgi:hypothetical protein
MAISLAAAWFLHPSPRLPASEPTAHTHPAARRPPGNRGRRDRDDDEQRNREPSQPRQPDRPIRQGTAQPNAEGGPADHFGWATELNRLNRAAEEGQVTGGRKRGGGGERRRLSLFLPPAQLPLNHHAGTRGYCKPTCNPSEETATWRRTARHPEFDRTPRHACLIDKRPHRKRKSSNCHLFPDGAELTSTPRASRSTPAPRR